MPFPTVIDWVWPGGRGPRENRTFHTYARRIRDALNRMADPPELTVKDGAYRIEVGRDEIDFFEFRTAAELAHTMVRDGDHESAIRTITPMLELWAGTPLADADGPRATDWRHSAQTLHLISAQETLLHALSALGRHDDVLRWLADLPVEHQRDLRWVKRRLEALYGLARYDEATTYHRDTRKRLTANSDQDEADELNRHVEELAALGRARRTARDPAGEPAGANLRPNLLPHDVGDFTGRLDLLRQLDTMTTTTANTTTATGATIPAAGLILLNGTPGVGKTALIVRWAHRAADRFPGGMLYADLGGFSGAPVTEPAEVVDGFLAALGFPVERIPTAAGRAAKLRNLLTGRSVLAVLDNVATTRDVLPLLRCLPCLVVVTSRRRLTGLARRGALDLTVPPLDYTEAKRWLTRRIGDRAEAEPDAAAELTALCGGSPLALRGVADHVAARPRVPLNEFVEELRDPHALLGLGDGDGPDGSVRTVFSWSYQILAEAERHLFRVLGTHPGPDISVDAAAALAGRDVATTRAGLDALVHAHLLNQPESRSRYRFHDLLRAYAAEFGTAAEHEAERAAAEARLLSYYLNTANDADRAVIPFRPRDEIPPLAEGVTAREFSSHETAMAWCVRERANLNAIIHHAMRRGSYAYVIRLAHSAGEILQRVGYHEDVLDSLGLAIQAARETGDIEGEGDSLSNLGFVHLNLRNFPAAERCLRTADSKYRAIGYQVGTAVVMHHLARLQVERGQFNRAIRLYHDALAILRAEGARGPEIVNLYRLGEAHRRAGNLDAAMSFIRNGLWLAERIGDLRGQAVCLTELASIYYERGELTSAKGYCVRGLALHERLRDIAQLGKTYNLKATIHRDEGDLAEAERCARRAVGHCHSTRHPRDEALAYHTLGYVLEDDARHDEATSARTKAVAILDDLGDPLADSVRAELNGGVDLPPPIPSARTVPMTPAHQNTQGQDPVP